MCGEGETTHHTTHQGLVEAPSCTNSTDYQHGCRTKSHPTCTHLCCTRSHRAHCLNSGSFTPIFTSEAKFGKLSRPVSQGEAISLQGPYPKLGFVSHRMI